MEEKMNTLSDGKETVIYIYIQLKDTFTKILP